MTMVADATPDLVGSNLAFHLNAGVDFVVVADPGTNGDTTGVLESYARDDAVRRVPSEEANPPSASELARGAAERGAEWVVPGRPEEFWWPRGESVCDVLA